MPSAWKFWWCPNHGDWGASTSGAFSSSCLIDLPGPRLCRRSNLQRIRQPEPQRSTLEPAGELQHDCRYDFLFWAWICTEKIACCHAYRTMHMPHCLFCCRNWRAFAQSRSAVLRCRWSASKLSAGGLRTFSEGFIDFSGKRLRLVVLGASGDAGYGSNMGNRQIVSLGQL